MKSWPVRSSDLRKIRGQQAICQSVEALEPRRLLATVAPGLDTDIAYGGTINNGTAMEFAPDGRLFVTTQDGFTWCIPAGGGAATLALTLPVDSFFERGLLGIAFDPTFDANAAGDDYVYLYWTDLNGANPSFNKIDRFTVTGNTINAGSATTIFSFNPLSAGNHNGGAIHFGGDGMLYAQHGENAVSSNSQILTNLLGKVIRINPAAFVAGDPLSVIPADNPTSFPGIVGTTSGINRAIWAVGLRNPYTGAFQPGTGRYHINDVGSGASSWEEVNLGQAGRNFGWPSQEGENPPPPGNPNFTYPVYTYPRAQGFTITGGAFYNTPAHTFPADYLGDYIFGDLSQGWMRRLDAANSYAVQTTGGASGISWLFGASAPVDVKIGPDGALYFLQRGGSQGVRVVRATDPLPYVTGSQFEFNGHTLPDAPHQLKYTFSENVGASLSSADLQLVNTTTSTTVPTGNIAVSYDGGTNTATFTFPGYPNGVLPDGDYEATLLAAGVTDAGQAMAVNHVSTFFFLQGDANHDREVNLVDYNILSGNYNQSPRIFSQGDFTYDGQVNLADYNELTANYNVTLGPSTTAAAPASKAASIRPLASPAPQVRASLFSTTTVRRTSSQDLFEDQKKADLI